MNGNWKHIHLFIRFYQLVKNSNDFRPLDDNHVNEGKMVILKKGNRKYIVCQYTHTVSVSLELHFYCCIDFSLHKCKH